MTNVEALKALYAALGGDPADVADATSIVGVLNVIAAKYEGADDATANAEAIANIAAVAENIGGGGDNNAEFAPTPAGSFKPTSNLKSIEIPEGVSGIATNAFSGFKALENVKLPSSLLEINNYAFQLCSSLKSIEIPQSVFRMEETVFRDCAALETIIVNKPEGSLNNAPWGATNAQVIWNG